MLNTERPKELKPMEAIVYRGYVIQCGLVGDYFVRKGGHCITVTRNLADAKAAVDLVAVTYRQLGLPAIQDDIEVPAVYLDRHGCPTCGGELGKLGLLGLTMHYQCRQCGSEWSEPAETYPTREVLDLDGFSDNVPDLTDLLLVREY